MDSEVEKSRLAKREEEILDFWDIKDVFNKSLEKESPKGEFVFYEGPPTANGKPGIHHLEARSFKDIMLRYKTMQGYHVRRKGGWDTHGLPVELQVEKALGLSSKKEIEAYGISEFNKKCKESVWEYVDLWERFTKRIGYWIDHKDPYITYDTAYIESVWNIVKKVSDQGLLYKDYKVVPWCPRCGTALSSHELAQGYADVKEFSVYAKFELVDEPGTYLLAWTTTPWTLPGNVALAVGENIEYVKVKVGDEQFILAKEKLSLIEEEYTVVDEQISGARLVGKEYKPLYDFLRHEGMIQGIDNAFKVYPADFVNTEDGTGIVHTAVMYGQEDFELGTEVGLPKVHVVKDDGRYIDRLGFLAGRFVKDEETAVEIIKDLAHRELLFKKEKYEHSYPHCWRCKTPLIYFARDSWYIRMSELRPQLVAENETINWEPTHIKQGRFGEWLKDVKDWAISRERYWGTPLPLWQKITTGSLVTIGSLNELRSYVVSSGNNYMVMRHGEAEHNVAGVVSSKNKKVRLTETGEVQAKARAEELRDSNIQVIITSPYARCKETADILRKELDVDSDNFIVDDRLGELQAGDFDGAPIDEYHSNFKNTEERFTKEVGGGETLKDLHKRVAQFMYEIDGEYKNKNILIVSHQAVITALHTLSKARNLKEMVEIKEDMSYHPDVSEIRELDFWRAPRNEEWEIDVHKPYIDDIQLVDKDGEQLIRVHEVLDVWFDSGAMPFAQDHYPFKNETWIDGPGYPADYITEAIDQTRGWFYTLHAVGALMGRGKAYKNVICLGHILDEHGKKMSKSVGNIIDPWEMTHKYGVDPLRFWMYTVNQPGDSKNFDEKTVDEIVKKVFNLISNTYTFYELNAHDNVVVHNQSGHVLDRWILSRLYTLIGEGEKNLDKYKIFEACRAIRDFANDLSTWYIRRSRDRFKSEDAEDKENALATTRYVLRELSKYMAPFIPFFAEDLYLKVRKDSDPESVHLESWPTSGEVDTELTQNMEHVRSIVSEALRLRSEKNMKVRQPLASLSITENLSEEFLSLIKDEVNVKEIVTGAPHMTLDTNLTPELIEEGMVRDLIRHIQEARKKHDFVADDHARMNIDTDETVYVLMEKYKTLIAAEANIHEVVRGGATGEPVKVGDSSVTISLSRL